MKKILIVEDDEALSRELSVLLTGAGYETAVLKNYDRALEEIREAGADLILLDITLPGVNGEELLRRLRTSLDTPVVMVTSRTSEVDEVLSMSYGADDYITKPYNPAILLLHISAVLRRGKQDGKGLRYGRLAVSPTKGLISDGKRDVVLTKNEMIIFSVLREREGRIVSRDELMTALWDNEEYVNDNALTVNISRLRAKLAEFGLEEAIETRKRQGYVLREAGEIN